MLHESLGICARHDPPAEALVVRARDFAIVIGRGAPGSRSSVADIPSVQIGQRTLWQAYFVRAEMTFVLRCANTSTLVAAAFAGSFAPNKNGELTEFKCVQAFGMATAPIAVTNTNNLKGVRDGALVSVVCSGDI